MEGNHQKGLRAMAVWSEKCDPPTTEGAKWREGGVRKGKQPPNFGGRGNVIKLTSLLEMLIARKRRAGAHNAFMRAKGNPAILFQNDGASKQTHAELFYVGNSTTQTIGEGRGRGRELSAPLCPHTAEDTYAPLTPLRTTDPPTHP